MKRQLGLKERATVANQGGEIQQHKGLGELALPGTIPSPLRTETNISASSGYATTDSERGTPSPPGLSNIGAYTGPPSGAGRFIEISLSSPAASPVHHQALQNGHSTLSKELDEFGPLRPM